MNTNRFDGFEKEVQTLVLDYERKRRLGESRYYDVEEICIVIDFYLETLDMSNLEEALDFAESLFPDELSVRLRRAHYYCGKYDYDKALSILRPLQMMEPDNTDVHYALGAIYSVLDQPQKSIYHYTKAAADEFQLDMIWGNIADEYCKMDDTFTAMDYYKKSININHEEERSLLNLFYCWQQQNKGEEAVAYYKDFVDREPYSKTAWYCLGCAYAMLSLTELAIDAYEFTLTIDKTYYNAYVAMADCLRQIGKTGEAVSRLREALDYSDDRGGTLLAIATIYLSANNYQTASVYLRQAVGEDKYLDEAWGLLADCYDQLGDAASAEPLYQRALGMNQDTDEHWLCYADFLMRHERYSDAIELLQEGVPSSNCAFDFDSRLVMCYQKTGKLQQLYDTLIAIDNNDSLKTLIGEHPELLDDSEVAEMVRSLVN